MLWESSEIAVFNYSNLKILFPAIAGNPASGRNDIEETQVEKLKIIETANAEQRTGEIQQAMEGADSSIALSKPGPGTLKRNGLS